MIFVGGVHGVGKSHFCDIIAEQMDILICSASKLIFDLKKENPKEDKKVIDIQKNQDYLVDAINQMNLKENYVLDGHFCLLDSNGNVVRIPYNTFERINPQAMIIICDSVDQIAQRLEERDGIIHDKDAIENFQNEELKYAKEISDSLNIKYLVYNNSEEIDVAIDFIKNSENEMEV
ncbi:MAG TPA: hypothetical protein DCP90_04320 [Clostridiales bacterium]|nr:MAG: hypothetical protein A2Y22_06945 [Clostridiales bacterium GWD2_32_59]HAN09820.1 hypothetical protein [Clostridiales bacterium]